MSSTSQSFHRLEEAVPSKTTATCDGLGDLMYGGLTQVHDPAVQRPAFPAERDERLGLTVPRENPVRGDLAKAFPAWQASGPDAILQPPKPEIIPSARILQLATEPDHEAAG